MMRDEKKKNKEEDKKDTMRIREERKVEKE